MIKLSELIVKPRGITPEKVEKYFINNIYNNDEEFSSGSDGWYEYIKLKNKYSEGIVDPTGTGIIWTDTLIEILPQLKLNQFYQEMRALVRKHVGKEKL